MVFVCVPTREFNRLTARAWRGAVVDLVGATRELVRDWRSGRLAWYTLLSPSLGKQEEGGEGEGTGGGRRRRTRSFARSMRGMKGACCRGRPPRKEMRRIRGGLVQLSCGKVDERTVDLEATVEVESDSDEAEIAFEPKVKGGILKASKGKKIQSDTESDEAEDDQSGEDTEEDEEGASGSEEEEEIDFGEEMEALPVLSTKLSGKRKRDSRKKDTDERQAKKVTFGPSTTSTSKSKPTAAAPKKAVPRGRLRTGLL